MSNDQELSEHYATQSDTCRTAAAALKHARTRAAAGQMGKYAEAIRAYDLAAVRWGRASRWILSTDPIDQAGVAQAVEDAIEFHTKGNERAAAINGTAPQPSPAAGPVEDDTDEGGNLDLDRIDTSAIVRGEHIDIADADDPELVFERLTAGTLADGRAVVVHEMADTDTPEPHRMPVHGITAHASPQAAHHAMLATAVASLRDWIPYRPGAASFLSWGDEDGGSVTPHLGGKWRLALSDSGEPSLREFNHRHEAELALTAACDEIADRLRQTGKPVDGLGGLWLGARTAELRAEALRAQFLRELQAAKEDRVVDRYGQINNADLANRMRVSTQRLSQLLAGIQ